MDAKVIIITGANTGIGFGLTKILVEEGHQVVMACRNLERGQTALNNISKLCPTATCQPMLYELDLADLSSVRNFADKFKKNFSTLSVLVNNAGISLGENKRCVTKDGHELVTGTNHLGHFLLTHLLLDLLKTTASSQGEARIVVVASQMHIMHEKRYPMRPRPMDFSDLGLEKPGAYSDMQAYKDSKAMNVMFTLSLSRQLKGSGVTANCICPGFVPDTDIARHLNCCFSCLFSCFIPCMRCCGNLRTIPVAAANVRILCCDPDLRGLSGVWFLDGEQRETSAESQDTANQDALWEWSRERCGI